MYRNRGLHKGISSESIDRLTKRFQQAPTRRKRQGLFFGVDFLEQLVNDLKQEGYDGVLMQFGIAPGLGNELPTYELVATQVELAGGDSLKATRIGVHYSSRGNESTNPPEVPSPPMSLGGS